MNILQSLQRLLAEVDPSRTHRNRRNLLWFHEPTLEKWHHRRLGYTHNHGKGESKKRRKMAKESRRINRRYQ